MNLEQWASRWCIPDGAMDELRELFGVNQVDTPSKDTLEDSEARVQSEIRLEAGSKAVRLMRNNVGAAYSKDGTFVRFGLCNDSKKMNKKIKSADLIGIRSVLITQEMVGTVIGQFVARECKRRGWTYTGTEEEKAQLAFLEMIAGFGGDATFANDVGTL